MRLLPVQRMSPAYRIGFGEDIHRLVQGRKLILGGVEIPYELGLLGHSDADVVLHALADSILSALGEDDIGAHFPDNDPSLEGLDSRRIIEFAAKTADLRGYCVGNTSISIIAERPKLRPYIDSMRSEIAKLLCVEKSCVGISANTNEGLDALGRKEAIKVHAVTLLERKEEK